MSEKRNSGRRKTLHRPPAEGSPRRHRRRPANKGQRYPAEILTADEVRALITACSNRAPTGVRNRALLVLLYRAGCRISEALRLRSKDLDRAAGTVTVLRGKGGARRTIGLDPGAFAVVERWLDVRAKGGINGRAPIICTLKGKPVASAYVRALMPRARDDEPLSRTHRARAVDPGDARADVESVSTHVPGNRLAGIGS
jgi:site-specific recombinase XerD